MKKEQKIELIRESIKKNRYPINDWKCSYYTKNNCYGYALGAEYNEINYKYFPENEDEEYIYNLGCISNSILAKDSRQAEKNFVSDMKVLGIDVRKSYLEEEVHDGEWKVVLFFDNSFIDSYDFHFARQNADGMWSHKEYCDGPVRILGATPEGCKDLDLVAYYMLRVKM